MIQQGNSIILTVEEFRLADQSLMITMVEKLKEDLNLNYWEELLDLRGTAKDLGVSVDKIYDWNNPEKTKVIIPFEGQPKRITRRAAREWHKKYSNIYTK